MFSTVLDELLLSLSATSDVRLFPVYGERKAWAVNDNRRAELNAVRARRAMDDGIPALRLSDAADVFEDGSRVFEERQIARREQLKAVSLHCLAGGGDVYLFARMADLIYAMCEEAFWGPPEAYASLIEGQEINELSLMTAGLLSTVSYLFKGIERQLPALKSAFAYAELAINARVLKPFLRRDDLPIFQGEDLPCAVEDVLTAALILGVDDRDRWLCVRKAVSYLDQFIADSPKDGSFRTTLEAHVEAAMGLSASADLVYRACNREVELRSDKMFKAIVHLPAALHIGGYWFANSASGSMLPNLSPDGLYEMARFAGDRELMALSAALGRIQKDSAMTKFSRRTPPLFRQIHQMLLLEQRLSHPPGEPGYEEVELPELRLYAKRSQGFYAALLGGAGEGHPSVGNFILFYEGAPIFFDIEGLSETRNHTLPTIDGVGQKAGVGPARDTSMEEKGVYTMVSMNIAPAYEQDADLISWQRTLLFTPMETGVRLMEVYDFNTADHAVAFNFVTPHRPEVGPEEVRVGPVAIRWEGELTARAQQLPGEVEAYRLTFVKARPSHGGNETFIITKAGG